MRQGCDVSSGKAHRGENREAGHQVVFQFPCVRTATFLGTRMTKGMSFFFEELNDIFCACESTIKDEKRVLVSVRVNFRSEFVDSQAEVLNELVMTLIGHVLYLGVAINPPENRDRTLAEANGCDDSFQAGMGVRLSKSQHRCCLGHSHVNLA